MATKVYIAVADGDLTSASTWGLVDQSSTTGTSFLDGESTSGGAVGTSIVYGANFQWSSGAPTVDGVAIKGYPSQPTGTGTLTVVLRNVTDSADVKTVTVNMSDLNYMGSSVPVGWIFFKFDAPTALSNSKNYAIGIVTSSASQFTAYTKTSAGNFSHMLRTTTTGAPTTDDCMHILDEWTAAATYTARAVVMDETATTSYGVSVTTTYMQSLTVGKYSSLTNETSASTNYNFVCKGPQDFYGTFAVGSSGSRFPSTSTASYKYDTVANGDSGARFIGTVNLYGTTKNEQTLITESIGGVCHTVGTAVTRVVGQSFTGLSGTFTIGGSAYTISSVEDADHLTLTATAGNRSYASYMPASSTVLKVGSTSGWVNGDTLAIAGTGQSVSEGESATISNVDSATQVTLSATLTNPHIVDGYDVVAEVVNLTRNVKFFGTSSYGAYHSVEAYCTGNIVDCEHYYWGYNATGKKGTTLRTVAGSVNFQHNSIYNSSFSGNIAVDVLGSSSNNILIENNVLYNVNVGMSLASSSNATHCHNNCIIKAGGNGITSGNLMHEISYNRIANAVSNALNFSSANGVTLALCDNNICHSSAHGITINAAYAQGNITNCKVYNNTGNGFSFTTAVQNIKISDSKTFGNSSKNILFTSAAGHILLDNVTLGGWIGSASAGSGVYMENVCFDVKSMSCSFGVTSGSVTGQVTSDFYLSGNNYGKWISINDLFGSSVLITGPTRICSMFPGDPSMLSFEKFNRTLGSHKSYTSEGLIEIDTTEYYGASGESTRMTPNSNATSGNRMKSHEFSVYLASGQTATPTLYLKKSSGYDGDQPRLYVKRNDAMGITSDTLLATYASGTGSWNSLGGVATSAVTDDGTLYFYVDCDYGTGGYINIDEITIT